MKHTAKIDYACKALVALSLHWPHSDPVQVKEIATREKIPINFLTQILLQLKQMGYVQSFRGKAGGYRLTQAPATIKLKDILVGFGGNEFIGDQDPTSGNGDVMEAIWNEIDEVVLRAIKEINFETITDRKRERESIVMFNI